MAARFFAYGIHNEPSKHHPMSHTRRRPKLISALP